MQLHVLWNRSAASAALTAGLLLVAAGAAAAPAHKGKAVSKRPAAPACNVELDFERFAHPLAHTARVLAAGKPLKIVAIGSSSTAGAGASTQAASYPSRLQIELTRRLQGHAVTVLNRGVNGEEASDMVARFGAAVVREKPDLVIWQVGTNSVLLDHPLKPNVSLLHGGIVTLNSTGADVVLLDPQFAPKVIIKANAEGMVNLIALTAKQESVDLFERFKLMRRWLEVDGLPFDTILSSDQLHMNDWSYACLAKWLGASIAEAATRPMATARKR
jgi:lysophospholipase L1-like esterase